MFTSQKNSVTRTSRDEMRALRQLANWPMKRTLDQYGKRYKEIQN